MPRLEAAAAFDTARPRLRTLTQLLPAAPPAASTDAHSTLRPSAHVLIHAGSRYAVDWWRGRVFAATSLLVMRHGGKPGRGEGGGAEAEARGAVRAEASGVVDSAAEAGGAATCDVDNPTGLCVDKGS